MKQRLLNVIKWFFILLGVLFFIQAIIYICVFLNMKYLPTETNTIKFTTNYSNNLKEIKPLIEYLENYQQKNNKYPEKIDDIKLNKKIDFEYKPTNDFNCYTLKTKQKNKKSTKEYQHCNIKTKNSMQSSESFVEYNY